MFYIKNTKTGKLIKGTSVRKHKAQFLTHLCANEDSSFEGIVFSHYWDSHFSNAKVRRMVIATIKDGQVIDEMGNDWLADFDFDLPL